MFVDLTRLRHIVAVSQARSFSRAAEELHTTQPALSRSILSFEENYGLKIFDRSRAGVEPTPVGKLVIAQAEEMLRGARSLDINLRLYATGDMGAISLGLGPLVAGLLLPRLSKHVFETKPGLQLLTTIGAPCELLQDLLDDRLELLIGSSWNVVLSPELAILPLTKLPVSVVVRSGHPLAQRRDLNAADLRPYPVASGVGLPLIELDGMAGALVCDNYHVLRDVVLDTDCVCVTCAAFVASDLVQGHMTQLDMTIPETMNGEVSIFHRRGRTLSPVANFVIEQVRLLLGPATAD